MEPVMSAETPVHPDPVAARLESLDTSVLSDAMTATGSSAGGAVIGVKPIWDCGRIAGRARTVRLQPPGAHPPGGGQVHLGAKAIERSDAGDVIVVEHQGRTDCAGWGGLLSAAAWVANVHGVIVDGACRDVEEARDIGLPVFARSSTPVSARGRAVEVETGGPVLLAGVRVDEGDYVLADACGIVVIPAAAVGEVVAHAEALARREAEMRDALLTGARVTTVMDRRYETMLDREPSATT
jgi:regulator of RNase E activity RraA